MVRTATPAASIVKIPSLALLAVLIMYGGACRNPTQTDMAGSLDSIQRYPDPVPVEVSFQPDQPVFPVDFGSYSEKTYIISNAEGRRAFLVKTNGSTRLIQGTGTGIALSRTFAVNPDSYPGRLEHEASLLFNANPPPILQEAQARSLARTITYGTPPPEYTEGTTEKNFWVEDDDGNFIEVPATLRAIGSYSYVWVANANYDAGSAQDRDNKLNAEQVRLIADRFDGTLEADYKDGIFRNVSSIFGFEYGGGDGGHGGRDGDQHISILLYDIDYDYTSTQTGGVLGYFWSKDFFTQTYLDSYYAGSGSTAPRTNYSEIFYLDAHFADRFPAAIYSTLAHEYQHMIHFNMKNIRLPVLSSAIWFNEMCSMVAEDLVLGNIGFTPEAVRSYGPQLRLDIFAYHYAESGVSDWRYDPLDSGSVLRSYAGAFAFGAYLARNFGGAAFFHELLHNDAVNEAAISAAMAAPGAVGNGQGFGIELLRYGEALVLTDSPADANFRSLHREVVSILPDASGGDPVSYTALPIDLGTIQQYSLYTNSFVSNGYGPRTYLPAESPSLRPYGTSLHTQSSWDTITGDLTVVLEAPEDSAVTFYLIIR
jgi:hypothetical protein